MAQLVLRSNALGTAWQLATSRADPCSMTPRMRQGAAAFLVGRAGRCAVPMQSTSAHTRIQTLLV